MKVSFTLVLVFFCMGSSAQTESLQLFYGQDPHEVRVIPWSRPPSLNFNDFLRGLDLEPVLEVQNKLRLEINGRELMIDTLRKVARYNLKEVTFPLRRREGEIYARVDNLVTIFSYLLGRDIVYEPTSKTMYVPRTKDLVVRARTRRIEDHFRIILDYSHAVEKPTSRQQGKKLIVTLQAPNIILDRSGLQANEAVAGLRLFQGLPNGTTEIVFSLTDRVGNATVQPYNPNNPRTVLKLTGTFTAEEDGMDETLAGAGVKRIVIDPGHGGKDRGAVGPTGLQEKEVTLDLAQRLKEALKDDFDITLTRRDDSSLSLKARTGIANHHKADLFISIHVNAIPSQNATGSETYYLALDGGPDAMDHAHYGGEETSGPNVDGADALDDDLSLMLWDMAQSKHLEDSFRVARYIQESLNQLSGIKSRGVKQLPLKVLRGAQMPAVLIEVAFISNKFEEKKLKSVTFREKVTNSVAAAVRRYHEDVIQRERQAQEEEGP